MVLKLLFAIAVVFGGIVLAAYLGQRRLMYFPDRTRTPPSAAGLTGVTEHEIAAPDGAYVVTWWGRAKPGQPTLLYFHGNAAALVARAPRVERAMSEGWGIAMMTYRSFGGSTGTPSEVANVADALRTLDWLETQGVTRRSIILYGESLGTGVATQVAVERPGIAGLILDAPYTSTVAVAKARYPFLPVEWGMLDRYETERHILRVTCPILIFHGRLDSIIPVAMGREIARVAPEPKQYIELPNAGHIDIYINGNDAFTPLKAWVQARSRDL
jgi:uncharacterized protein